MSYTDRREKILHRLSQIIESIPEVDLFKRNDIEVPEDRVPAVVLLDGDETVDESSFDRGRRATGPLVVTMTPELYVLVSDHEDDVGPTLTDLRARIIQAVTTDSHLAGLAHNGDIRYLGMQTGLALGRSVAGEMGMVFAIVYPMYPGHLVAPAPTTETET